MSYKITISKEKVINRFMRGYIRYIMKKYRDKYRKLLNIQISLLVRVKRSQLPGI